MPQRPKFGLFKPVLALRGEKLGGPDQGIFSILL